MRWILLFCWVLTSANVRGQIQFKKCCEDGQQLGKDRSSCREAVSTAKLETSLGSLGLQFEQFGTGFPRKGCHAYESFQLSGEAKNKISTEGELTTDKYRKSFPLGSFCLDLHDEQLYAVTCDQCRSGVPCINVCCPKGQLITSELIDYEFYDEELSGEIEPREEIHSTPAPHDGGAVGENASLTEYVYEEHNPCQNSSYTANFNLTFWNENDALNFEEDKHFRLVYPTGIKFECPIDPETGHPAIFIPHSEREDSPAKIMPTGVLDGLIDEMSSPGEIPVITRRQPEQYCVSYEQNEQGEISSDKIYYGVCVFTPAEVPCEKIRFVVFNAGFVLTLIFIILTIIAHLIETQLRDSIFGKITLAYLVNLFLYFAILLDERIQGYEPGTTSCIVSGYLQQYFYLSFFTWINAMGIFFCTTLGSMRQHSGKSLKFRLTMVSYTQGFPLLICLVTLIVDKVREQREAAGESFDPHHYPEMGLYGCTVGHAMSDNSNIYFGTPEFIYIQLWTLLLLISNLVMFIVCAHTIINVRSKARQEQTKDQVAIKRKENFIILLKLFVYMVFVWMFEIVTSAIAAEYGIGETCVLRTVLDTPNVLYGLIIFLVLVCSKKPVLRSLTDKVTFVFSTPTQTAEVSVSVNQPRKISKVSSTGQEMIEMEKR